MYKQQHFDLPHGHHCVHHQPDGGASDGSSGGMVRSQHPAAAAAAGAEWLLNDTSTCPISMLQNYVHAAVELWSFQNSAMSHIRRPDLRNGPVDRNCEV